MMLGATSTPSAATAISDAVSFDAETVVHVLQEKRVTPVVVRLHAPMKNALAKGSNAVLPPVCVKPPSDAKSMRNASCAGVLPFATNRPVNAKKRPRVPTIANAWSAESAKGMEAMHPRAPMPVRVEPA